MTTLINKKNGLGGAVATVVQGRRRQWQEKQFEMLIINVAV